jgi:hypothetical protein
VNVGGNDIARRFGTNPVLNEIAGVAIAGGVNLGFDDFTLALN